MISHCCCCCKLETGGAIIGWYNFIVNLTLVIVSITYIIISSLDANIAKCKNTENEYKELFCPQTTFVVISILGITFGTIRGWISYMCITGIKNRNHTQIEPMLYMLGFTAFINILSLFLNTFSGMLYLVLVCYEFVVIYSLHTKFDEESYGQEGERAPTGNDDMVVVSL